MFLFYIIRNIKYLILFLLASLTIGNSVTVAASPPKNRDVVVIHQPDKPRSEKQAILLIPGLDETNKGRRTMADYFSKLEYDLFIPDYVDEDSFEGSVDNFTSFFEEQRLEEYESIHVVSYILGTWVLNRFINEKLPDNIQTIIYDRSPLQERAALVATEKIPLLARIAIGDVVEDFSKLPYTPIEKGDIRIGILVESKATALIRFFEKETMAKGNITWTNLDFKQSHDDMMYVPLNHDEMYFEFDLLGPEILHFIEHGSFSAEARRTWFDWDPFEKRKK
jgi:hypothetical protein